MLNLLRICMRIIDPCYRMLSTIDQPSDRCYTMYIVNEVKRMNTIREQLCMNLSYLTDGDAELTNAIILEYVSLLDNKRLNDMLEYTSKEMRANV